MVTQECLRMLNPIHHKEVLLEWVRAKQVCLDMAFAVHVPSSETGTGRARDDIWLSQKLSRFFRQLDERIARHGIEKHVERLVVMHLSPDVGWHAHFQIATPQHMAQQEFADLVKRLWLRSVGGGKRCTMKRRLFWAEEVRAGYLPYMLGHLSIDTVDWENTYFTS